MEFKFYFNIFFPPRWNSSLIFISFLHPSRFISDPHRTKMMLSSADDRRTFTNKLHRLKGDLDYFMGRIEAPYNDVTETDKKRYCSVIIEMMEFLVKRIENVSTLVPLHYVNRSLEPMSRSVRFFLFLQITRFFKIHSFRYTRRACELIQLYVSM